MEQSYDGFEIVIVNPNLIEAQNVFASSLTPSYAAERIEVAQAGPFYPPVFMPLPSMDWLRNMPSLSVDAGDRIVGDIRLLKRPFVVSPSKVFDAAELKAALDRYVRGPKCEKGKMCVSMRPIRCLNGNSGSLAAGNVKIGTMATTSH